MTNEADEVDTGVGNGRTTTLGKEDPMDGSGWLGVMVVVYVLIVALIIAAIVLHFTVNRNADELRWEMRDLRREIGTLQREVEYRDRAYDRDVERLLRELQRAR